MKTARESALKASLDGEKILAKVEITAPLIFTANLADSRLQNSFHNSAVI